MLVIRTSPTFDTGEVFGKVFGNFRNRRANFLGKLRKLGSETLFLVCSEDPPLDGLDFLGLFSPRSNMFLRSTTRKKDGKEPRYYSVVESSRASRGARPHQRPLLYLLGEINSEQQSAWTKAIEVFDTQSQGPQTFSLFPSDKTIPANLAAPGLPIRVDQYELTRPRQYGACWLGGELWRSLNLDAFWRPKLGVSREGTAWTSLLQVSVIYRLIAPGSEWRLHRQWYDQSAMGDLLSERLHWGGKDQLYQVLDKLLEHREALFTHLQARWQDLFGVKYEVLLYD